MYYSGVLTKISRHEDCRLDSRLPDQLTALSWLTDMSWKWSRPDVVCIGKNLAPARVINTNRLIYTDAHKHNRTRPHQLTIYQQHIQHQLHGIGDSRPNTGQKPQNIMYTVSFGRGFEKKQQKQTKNKQTYCRWKAQFTRHSNVTRREPSLNIIILKLIIYDDYIIYFDL